jgi:hypothetical protein
VPPEFDNAFDNTNSNARHESYLPKSFQPERDSKQREVKEAGMFSLDSILSTTEKLNHQNQCTVFRTLYKAYKVGERFCFCFCFCSRFVLVCCSVLIAQFVFVLDVSPSMMVIDNRNLSLEANVVFARLMPSLHYFLRMLLLGFTFYFFYFLLFCSVLTSLVELLAPNYLSSSFEVQIFISVIACGGTTDSFKPLIQGTGRTTMALLHHHHHHHHLLFYSLSFLFFFVAASFSLLNCRRLCDQGQCKGDYCTDFGPVQVARAIAGQREAALGAPRSPARGDWIRSFDDVRTREQARQRGGGEFD